MLGIYSIPVWTCLSWGTSYINRVISAPVLPSQHTHNVCSSILNYTFICSSILTSAMTSTYACLHILTYTSTYSSLPYLTLT